MWRIALESCFLLRWLLDSWLLSIACFDHRVPSISHFPFPIPPAPGPPQRQHAQNPNPKDTTDSAQRSILLSTAPLSRTSRARRRESRSRPLWSRLAATAEPRMRMRMRGLSGARGLVVISVGGVLAGLGCGVLGAVLGATAWRSEKDGGARCRCRCRSRIIVVAGEAGGGRKRWFGGLVVRRGRRCVGRHV